jgi:uncharacterized protein (TIGR03435 family)
MFVPFKSTIMKKQVILLLFSLFTQLAYAQLKVGQPVGHLPIPQLLNSKSRVDHLDELKGKVVWLEFWATWCSPCVAAMPHLQKLQEEFAGRLQVITVSTEKEKRIRQYMANQPSNLWFALDSADQLRKPFPYRLIPHSVLIDTKGTIIAITDPQNITSQVIADVIAGKEIDLPKKEDNTAKDPWAVFTAPDTIKARFVVQPKIDGLPSGYRRYPKDSTFKNRRVSMLNLPLESIYRIAYGDLPYGRTIDLTDQEAAAENGEMYCVDLIVPKGKEDDLLPALRRELKVRFNQPVSVEKRLRTVYVLTVSNPAKVQALKQSTVREEEIAGGSGTFAGDGIQLTAIARYLEGFGLVKMPVVDATGNSNRYDIAFTYQPEKKGDLQRVLASLGLSLVKQEKEIDMLIFR